MEDETTPPIVPAPPIEKKVETVETTTVGPAPDVVRDSKLFGMSLRGLIVLIIVATVCVMSYMAKEVKEPLYTLAGLCIGYYFGQNQRQHKS